MVQKNKIRMLHKAGRQLKIIFNIKYPASLSVDEPGQ